MGCAQRIYQPRHAEAGVLHGVIRDHVDDFLRAAADRAEFARSASPATLHFCGKAGSCAPAGHD